MEEYKEKPKKPEKPEGKKHERPSSAAQGLVWPDLQHLIEAEQYDRALSWIDLKIEYIGGVIREIPRVSDDEHTVSHQEWKELRASMQKELRYWKDKRSLVSKRKQDDESRKND